jgi:hypothetical protein
MYIEREEGIPNNNNKQILLIKIHNFCVSMKSIGTTVSAA